MIVTHGSLEDFSIPAFDRAAVLPVGPPAHGDAFQRWLRAGYHGDMGYLARRLSERMDLQLLAPGTRSMIVVVANYNPGPPPAGWSNRTQGRFARYAWGSDYHNVVKSFLFQLDARLRALTGRKTQGKVCVDTAPLLERDFAQQAGLGFVGRNTCLISPGLGSWTFLGALLVPEVLEIDESCDGVTSGMRGAVDSHRGRRSIAYACGRCTRCLEACPTAAFPHEYVLDARRCISYLTIEHRGPIPRELRPLMGNWVFGCDICQEVCPYNRLAPPAHGAIIRPDTDRAAPLVSELLALSEAAFRARFKGSAMVRAGRRGLVRNACIAAGNSGDPGFSPALAHLLTDAEPLVRGHAAWALGRLGGHGTAGALSNALSVETDSWVLEDISYALARLERPDAT